VWPHDALGDLTPLKYPVANHEEAEISSNERSLI